MDQVLALPVFDSPQLLASLEGLSAQELDELPSA